MKLVVVAMPESVHTARWLAQVASRGWEIHLFSSHSAGYAHPALHGVEVHHLFRSLQRGVRQRGFPLLQRDAAYTAERVVDRAAPGVRRDALVRLLSRVRPDVVHSLELQHGAYLTLRARDAMGSGFPPWIVTNWGSDIVHFGQDPAHAATIRRVLAAADAYTAECARDVRLAREFGFAGTAFPPTPNAGGYDLALATRLRSGAPSRRRVVMIKGYQHWAGRALVALRAVEAAADALRGFRVCVYSATSDVAREARAIAARTGVQVDVLGGGLPHAELLRLHGAARVSVGLSLCDGASTSFLEALLMGSFPVQSWTACANEWVEDGETGILVPPEEPEPTAEALRRALSDDALVDRAAERNWEVARARLDGAALARQAAAMYESVAALRGGGGPGPVPPSSTGDFAAFHGASGLDRTGHGR